MGFLAPWNLLALLGLVVLGALYLRLLRGRSSSYVWYPGAGQMGGLAPRSLWHYLPAIGFFLALAAASSPQPAPPCA